VCDGRRKYHEFKDKKRVAECNLGRKKRGSLWEVPPLTEGMTTAEQNSKSDLSALGAGKFEVIKGKRRGQGKVGGRLIGKTAFIYRPHTIYKLRKKKGDVLLKLNLGNGRHVWGGTNLLCGKGLGDIFCVLGEKTLCGRVKKGAKQARGDPIQESKLTKDESEIISCRQREKRALTG